MNIFYTTKKHTLFSSPFTESSKQSIALWKLAKSAPVKVSLKESSLSDEVLSTGQSSEEAGNSINCIT